MPILATTFTDNHALSDHYKRHGVDVGAISRSEYETMAASFINTEGNPAIKECTRPGNGDIIKYNVMTDEFGTIRNDGVIKTYFIAKTQIHGCSTNLDYFYQECMK